MSKALLKALLKIFALIIKVDEVTEEERQRLEEALGNQLNQKLVQFYMDFFDKEVEKLNLIETGNEEAMIIELCTSLNLELTRHQKIAILIQLVSVNIAEE